MEKKHFLLVGILFLSCKVAFTQTPNYLTPTEATFFNQHVEEAKSFAKITAGEKNAELLEKFVISDDYKLPIRTIVEERELRMSIYNFIYPDNDALRYQAKLRIKKEYDSVLTKNLLYSGANATTYNYSLVLKYNKEFTISPTQFDSIVNKAIEINSLIENNPKLDVWGHELSTFLSILTSKQLDLFLELKNHNKVKSLVASSLAKLKDNKLDYDLDLSRVNKELFRYHMANLKAADLYYNNDSLKRETWKGINSSAPVAIQRIKALANAQIVAKTFNGALSW